jgi:hypothetical protein
MYSLIYDPACVMNVITHDTAYSIYPRATFIKRRSLVCNRLESSLEGHAKYEWCGWIQVPYLNAGGNDDPSSSFARGPRRLGDRRCWTITLLPTVDLDNNYMDSNTWNLHYFGRGGLSNWKFFPHHSWMLLKEKWLLNNVYLMDQARGYTTTLFINAFQTGKLYSAASAISFVSNQILNLIIQQR